MASHQRWGHEATGLRLLQGHIKDVHGALGPRLLQQLVHGQEGAQLGHTPAAIDLQLDGVPGRGVEGRRRLGYPGIWGNPTWAWGLGRDTPGTWWARQLGPEPGEGKFLKDVIFPRDIRAE